MCHPSDPGRGREGRGTCLALALSFCGSRGAAPASLRPVSDPVAKPLNWTPARGEGEFLLQAGGVARGIPGERRFQRAVREGCLGFRAVSWPLRTLEWKRVLEESSQGNTPLGCLPRWLTGEGGWTTAARAAGFRQLPQQEPLGCSHGWSVNKLPVSPATHSHHGRSDCCKVLPCLKPASTFSFCFQNHPG